MKVSDRRLTDEFFNQLGRTSYSHICADLRGTQFDRRDDIKEFEILISPGVH